MPHAESTCVDTSAWIEYLRDSRHPAVEATRELIETAHVCVADVVWGELFQGARNAKERAILEECAGTIPVLAGTPRTWQAAGRLAAELRGRGITLHLIDCYLATLVQEHRVALLTCDRHFDAIRRFSPSLHLQLV